MNQEIQLLPWQQEVMGDPSRFKVVVAGRRCGKSHMAAVSIIHSALAKTKGVTMYVAPTQSMAREIMFSKLAEIAHPMGLIEGSNINNLEMTLVGGRKIYLKGADRPDTMRGLSVNHLVLDEFAFFKNDVYETILRPTLSDLKGSALFIGTPAGRNHFFDIYCGAVSGDWPDYNGWTFTTYDNPLVDTQEIEHARHTLPDWAFNQEYKASFDAKGSEFFKTSDFPVYTDSDRPKAPCQTYIAVDLAGFQSDGPKKGKRRDSSAMAVVDVDDEGNWWVVDMVYGQWDLTTTAQILFDAVQKYRPTNFGIEKGIAQQAILSPLQDLMRKRQRVFHIELLAHNNQKKEDRILWALQGRAQSGSIKLKQGIWNERFIDEAVNFPSPLVHDDLIDALAYIDQMAHNTYFPDEHLDTWEPLDAAVGF